MTGDPFADVDQFEKQLGLPEGFYNQLLKEDDWSFVIKLNALFEAATTHILVVRLQTPELEEALAHLDFAHSKYGKVALLRKLEAISKEQATLLRRIAELRNELVHDVSSVGFSFATYVSSLDENQLERLVNTFGHGVADPVPIAKKNIPRKEFVKSNPKIALWLTSIEVLACLYLEKEMTDLRLKQLVYDEATKLLNLSTPDPLTAP
jgi:hypothetical protein